MRKTTISNIEDQRAVDTPNLQKMLNAGYRTAVQIGTEAEARIKVGRRVLWNVNKKRGKENAVSSAALAEAVGFRDIRSLQADIAKSRAEGQVICSSTTGGYYLPADRAEIEAFIHSLEARAKNTFGAIRSAREAVRHIEGQLSLEDIK